MGASNFGFDATGESLAQSSCTTAKLKADMSAYWFPTLYFQDPDTGLLEQVKFFYMNVYYFFDATNDDLKAFPLGLQMVSGNAMLRKAPSTSGDAQLDPKRGPIQPAQITCPRSNFNPPSWPSGSDGSMAGIQDSQNQGSGTGFPFQDCDGYASPMRIDVHFPSCYNPEAGLTKFTSNMQFPSDAGNGKLDCPPGWIHVPHLFFETYWDTHAFAGRFEKLNGKASPFVFSNGDTTGFSAHGDFISGWDEGELQHIIDSNCDAGHAGLHSCPGLKLGVNADNAPSCNIKCPVDEVIDGKLDKLPGNNPLAGWARGGGNLPVPQQAPVNTEKLELTSEAVVIPSSTSEAVVALPSTTLVPVVVSSSKPSEPPVESKTTQVAPKPDPTTTTVHRPAKITTVYETVTIYATKTVYSDTKPTDSVQESNTSPTPQDIAGFKYVGCYRDNAKRRIAGEILPKLGLVSNTACVNYCASKGFAVAGTEYGGECYCGNSISTAEKLDDKECAMKCKGDDKQTCGDDWALSVFAKGGQLKNEKRHAHYLHHARVPSRRHFQRR
ncbi:hypothetical protein N0V88_001937 [Collariella sp. IMI 366227]|nr:hypothetical protein N0V88_001937 [Collariella sp. IMI 366227]